MGAHLQRKHLERESAPQTQGQGIPWPRFSDFLLWVVTRGKESAFRQMTADLKRRGLTEIACVLKPEGCLLVIDSNLHRIPFFTEGGFSQVETGEVSVFQG